MTPLAELLDCIEGQDDAARVAAYLAALARTDTPTDVYAQWGRLEALLASRNNHIRSIGGQLVSHVAASDPEGRILALWERWEAVACDRMFVTARHTLQASPRLARGNAEHRHRLLEFYERRFLACGPEKNATLIRYDLHVCLRQVYDLAPDPKYRNKNKTAWRSLL